MNVCSPLDSNSLVNSTCCFRRGAAMVSKLSGSKANGISDLSSVVDLLSLWVL